MAFLNDLRTGMEALFARFPGEAEADELLPRLRACDSGELLAVLSESSRAIQGLERIVAIASGVVAERSTRDAGHAGLAAQQGHRTAVDLVQAIGGTTRAEAVRAVRVGESLVEGLGEGLGDGLGEGAGEPPSSGSVPTPARRPVWHEPLRRALLDGVLTAAQHDAIRRGLGEPPGADDSTARAGGDSAEDEGFVAATEVWRLASEELMRAAGELTVEDLAGRARQVRDTLDPAGAEERFARRYAARSLRTWRDAEGVRRGSIVFDDEGGAWFDSLISAALRPRRGGPRFVDADATERADELTRDPRTTAQLTYDLVMDVLRSGSLAEAADVFGARQPGVRMVVVKHLVGPRDRWGRLLAAGHLEDGGDPVPGSVIDRALCENGFAEVTVDECGNPLDVGREQRLFQPRQRLALAVRDGGCVWQGCRVPASYCEAHHCDHWWEHGGRTDIDRGVLLCRFHHMLLHNNGWRIVRDGMGPFILHPPGEGEKPVVLTTKAAWSWAWDPPPPPKGMQGWRGRSASSGDTDDLGTLVAPAAPAA